MGNQTQTQAKTKTSINIEEIINRMYLKYLQVSDKERKVEAVKKAANAIGYNWLVDDVRWDARSSYAWVTADIPKELKAKIRELWKYAFPRYIFVDAFIAVTTKDICEDKTTYDNEIIGKYCFNKYDYERQATTYVKLGEVEVDNVKVYIYLQVADEDAEDC